MNFVSTNLLKAGSSRNKTLAIAITILVICLLPLVLDNFRISLMGKYLAFAIAAVSLNMIWGYTGILSLGHALFFALGAYVMAYHLKLQNGELPDFMGWSGLKDLPWFIAPLKEAWFAFPMIIILPAIFAFLIGWPTFRSGIKGVYFTILSQALALALSIFFVGQQPYTGGTNGITNFKGFGGVSIRLPDMIFPMYYVTFAVLILAIVACWALLRSKTGQILLAIRDGEQRLRFLGYNPVPFKLFVFMASAGLAGIAGALFVTQVGIISPSMMGILPSVEMAIWVAAGGRGTLLGPAIGAILVNSAKTFFSESFPDIWLYFLGLLFIGVVLVFPKGIMGVAAQIRDKGGFQGIMAKLKNRSGLARTPAASSIADELPPGTDIARGKRPPKSDALQPKPAAITVPEKGVQS